jgi:hypothetical protein
MKAIITSRYGNKRLLTLVEQSHNTAIWTIEREDQKPEEGFMRCGPSFIDFDGGPFLGNGNVLAVIKTQDSDDIHVIDGVGFDKDLGKYKIITNIVTAQEALIQIDQTKHGKKDERKTHTINL